MEWTPIIVSCITALATILTVVIQSKASAKKTKRLIEVNDYRTHLLLLLASYPDKADEIFSVGRYYFEGLDGDSFVLPIFSDWLKDKGLDAPEWFLEALRKHPKPDGC